MDSNNWRAAQAQTQIPGQVMGGEAAAAVQGMEGVDWRTQLQPDSRQRIVNKIMETLKRHLPFSGQEGLQELKKIAVRFEEWIYAIATSQSDYLRKISSKMLIMEKKSQNHIANSLQSNSASNNRSPQDPDYARLLEKYRKLYLEHEDLKRERAEEIEAHEFISHSYTEMQNEVKRLKEEVQVLRNGCFGPAGTTGFPGCSTSKGRSSSSG